MNPKLTLKISMQMLTEIFEFLPKKFMAWFCFIFSAIFCNFWCNVDDTRQWQDAWQSMCASENRFQDLVPLKVHTINCQVLHKFFFLTSNKCWHLKASLTLTKELLSSERKTSLLKMRKRGNFCGKRQLWPPLGQKFASCQGFSLGVFTMEK